MRRLVVAVGLNFFCVPHLSNRSLPRPEPTGRADPETGRKKRKLKRVNYGTSLRRSTSAIDETGRTKMECRVPFV